LSEDQQENTGPGDVEARIRPRARIMRTLGDELISSEVVAVTELVKNAYDADATHVIVRLREPLEAGEGGIDVIDNGHGMSLDTVEHAWLEPATPYRRDARRSERLGRRVLGEKGIGRFAVSKLANELELITRRGGDPLETRVLFDWSVFDDPDAYLDEIAVVLEQGAPTEIRPGGAIQALWPAGLTDDQTMGHGTLLRMSALRMPWDQKRVETLRASLSRLVSPFLFEESLAHGGDTFVIDLDVPMFPGLAGPVEPPETIRNPVYRIQATVNPDATYDATIVAKAPGDAGLRTVHKQGRIDGFGDRPPACGGFSVQLRAWDRDRVSIADLARATDTTPTQARRDLNEAAGVSLYRDGFRVLPYGDQGNDWLRLDARRVNSPTFRLSNNQIVGYVLISRDDNPELLDQTNREGLIANQAFEDLRHEIRGILTLLETERYDLRPREQKPAPSRPGGVFAGFDLAAVQAYAAERHPGDTELSGLLDQAQEELDAEVAQAQETVARYRRLATLGELVDKVLHDGRAPLAKMGDDARLGIRDLDRDEDGCEELLGRSRKRFERISKQHDVLAGVLRRIEPLGGRKRGRPAQEELETIVSDSVAVLESDVKAAGIKVELPTSHTLVTVDPGELQQVFVNLLRNSIYWLKEVPRDERRIRVEVTRLDDGVELVFSDSGPGVPEELHDRIFDAYFTTATNGVGLGLSIAGEIVKDYYGGDLGLREPGPLRGANFVVTLRHRV
jgi:signal transduction histidine kinase